MVKAFKDNKSGSLQFIVGPLFDSIKLTSLALHISVSCSCFRHVFMQSYAAKFSRGGKFDLSCRAADSLVARRPSTHSIKL